MNIEFGGDTRKMGPTESVIEFNVGIAHLHICNENTKLNVTESVIQISFGDAHLHVRDAAIRRRRRDLAIRHSRRIPNGNDIGERSIVRTLKF